MQIGLIYLDFRGKILAHVAASLSLAALRTLRRWWYWYSFPVAAAKPLTVSGQMMVLFDFLNIYWTPAIELQVHDERESLAKHVSLPN